MNRIESLFGRLKAAGRPALMPFVTAGDPNLDATGLILREMIAGGADMIEVGIPYSDPIADGPVIAASYHRALQNGAKLGGIFEMIRRLRAEGGPKVDATPFVAMLSYAIIHRRGVDEFFASAKQAGFDGLIIPDLPIEEASNAARLAQDHQLGLIQLITPTTSRERSSRIAETTTGFIYYVSVAGITGERNELPPDLADKVAWLRTNTKLPVCIGFGISSAEQVRALSKVGDGLIVGSALVKRIDQARELPPPELADRVGEFVKELASGLAPSR